MLTAATSAPLQRESVNSNPKRPLETAMPWDQVMKKFQQKKLRSGSADGPVVTNPKQAVAIQASEKEKAGAGDKEYQPRRDFLRKMARGGK